MMSGRWFKKKRKFRELTSKIPLEAGQVTRLKSLYQLYKPRGEPSMEVIFFHGFQRGNYENAHISSWKCRDGSSLWPQTWLVEQFPGAHILSVCYGENVLRSCEGGRIDIHIMTENLTSDLLDANIGQAPSRPVVFVGHSFGGLVIKKLCVYASNNIGRLSTTTESSFRLTSLMDNLRGMFFYSTPHLGVSDHIAKHIMGEGPLLEYVTTLNTEKARVHDDFDNLCGQRGKYKMWQIAGVGEGLPTSWGEFKVQVVSEASARYHIFNVVEGADHITVCRPIDKNCRSFSTLANFLRDLGTRSQEMVHGLPDRPTALQSRSFKLQQELKSSPVLGIVGMGGIGKTTIAKKLFNDISPQFEYTCFVDNVKERKIHDLNDWILNHFFRDGVRVDQNSLQWSHLERKKALITMDDVNCEDQVRTLPGLNKFGDGSRLIFTTRDRGVLNCFSHPFICDVSFLDFDEARKLFCERAFEEEGIPQKLLACNDDLERNVQRVVEKCNGLPLTLEVMGSYLRCHESNGAVWKGHKTYASVWKETLDKLGNAEPIDGLRKDRVWDTLRVSFDSLAHKEQVLFIEAGISFFKWPVERALAARSVAYGDSQMIWANLLRTSMVKEVDNSEFDYWQTKFITYKEVWVHEHLRDLATFLYKEAIISKSVGEWYTGPRLGHFISVKERNRNPQQALDLPDQFENLKYMELFGRVQEGLSKNLLGKLSLFKWSGLDTKREFAVVVSSLPISLEHMSNLAVLELEHWEISGKRFEALEKLSCLRILSLSNIKGPVRLPDNLGRLSRLKQLKLRQLRSLTALPESFGELSALEDLVLSECDQLLELPKSFGSLHSLATLRIFHCRQLASLPDSFGQLMALEKLEIVGDTHLAALPDDFGNLRSLKFLALDCDGLERLPDSFGLLSGLQQLSMRNCKRLQSLPDNFGELMALEKLTVAGLKKLEALPDDFGNLLSLKFLILNDCDCLERLPESFGLLSALQKLTLRWCQRLQSLSDNFGKLTALKQLTILKLGQLETLSDDFGNLRSLKFLTLSHCDYLQRLPESFSLLAALQELTLENCERLQSLPDNFGKLRALEKLSILNRGLETLPDDFGNLLSLKSLTLRFCDGLQRLPESFGLLSALEVLALISCQRLQSLPDNFGKLTALQMLTISELEKLEAFPDDFGNLRSLKSLTLESCDCLQRLPESFGLLSALQKLTLRWCQRLQSLSDNFGKLTALKQLTILKLGQLETLSDDFGNLRSLKFLTLSHCEYLQRLPESFGLLSALQKLTLSCCQRLQSLSDNFGKLTALKELTILKLEKLEAFPDDFGNLRSLKSLTLESCDCLQRLPESFGLLSALQKLTLKWCQRLQSLSDNFGKLTALKELTILKLGQLETLSDDFGNLRSLKFLTLSHCDYLQRLPESFGLLSALQKLTLRWCQRLQSLSDNFGKLTALEELIILKLGQLETLSDDFGNLRSLKFLTLSHCDYLQRFPESFGLLFAHHEFVFKIGDCPLLDVSTYPEAEIMEPW